MHAYDSTTSKDIEVSKIDKVFKVLLPDRKAIKEE